MGTTIALWGGRFRESVSRFVQGLSGDGATTTAPKTEDDFPVIQLSDEAAERLERLADEAERGIDVSPRFTTLEDAFAYLDEETKKYKEGVWN